MYPPLHIDTPLLESTLLGKRLGKTVLLKMDALQPSGSFKIRGIGRLCSAYAAQGANYFISPSGGNAGLATAYAGRKYGVQVKVVVPHTTKDIMKHKIASEGAEVIVHGENLNQADEFARQLVQGEGVYYIPPFDHPLIWEGHASLISELEAKGYKPDAVVVSVGGGGLFCGLAQGMQKVGWDNVPIITAETKGAASFAKSLDADQLVTLSSIETIATSLGLKRVALQAIEWTRQRPVYAEVVTDKEAVHACLQFLDEEHVLVEPACGAGLAVLYERRDILKNFQTILVIVCGGSGVSLDLLRGWQTDFSLI